jgi:hypothetical protein
MLCLLALPLAPATAQVSVSIGLPNVSIGINLPLYPELRQVPGYPVYYAPRLKSNYFFYDGMYWVYQEDNWYASSWYNGPWWAVAPDAVPLYVLRVPVRYYRQPPAHFHGWQLNAPPRWGDHWGNEWSQRRSGWDRWNRNATPAPAPLPIYQKNYSGNRYPGAEHQPVLQQRNYRYQPRDPVVKQQHQAQRVPIAPPAPQRQMQEAPRERNVAPQEPRRAPPPPAAQQQRLQPQREATPQVKGASREPDRGQRPDKEKDREKAEDHGQDRKR